MTTAPRGATIVDFFERRRKHRLHIRSTAPNQLIESLRRLKALRQELDLWNEAEGDRPMPQPQDCGIQLPNLRPSDVHWGATG
jgi:hypothetical protein